MLKSINSPQDLHQLTVPELALLAKEIRQVIIDTVVETGGHLGANLGVVELTLALHSVLNTPDDKIIWDVGHQCYTHKLVTGRQDQFGSLRQLEGISGFPKRAESIYDAYDVGHSSTSISAACGLALARDLQQKHHAVVAVIGDGALTGGLALEALNHAGQLQTNLVVVLNDNAMSIAGNVGALSDYLNRIRLDPTLSRARGELDALIKRIPAIGSSMTRVASGVKDAVKSLLPGQLFEELGFSYFGPFDGHNIGQLQRAINDSLTRKGPVLVHVLTQKGKGYAPAERNPAKYHGVGPRSQSASLDKTSELSYSKIFGNTITDLASRDSRIVAISAAMMDGTGLTGFAEKYPKRFFDVGIAEQHALTLAAGLATQGMKPVVALYSTFLQRGYDQVVHDICLQNLPVIIGIDRAGVVGDDGPTHHGVFDISFLRHIPNLTLLAPKDGTELNGMLRWAISQDSPVAIRYPRGTTTCCNELADSDCLAPEVFGDGQDCVIIAVGNMVRPARDGMALLGKELACRVINIRQIKPLDQGNLLRLIGQTKRVVTIEDHTLAGGFGSVCLECISDQRDILVLRLGYPDHFIDQGCIAELHARYFLDADGIANRIRAFSGQQIQIAHAEGEY